MTQLVSVRSFPLVNGKRILPEGVVYIGRAQPRVGLKASEYANPYRVGGKQHPEGHGAWSAFGRDFPSGPCECSLISGVETAYWCFRNHLDERLTSEPDWLEPLRGKTLACWCDRLTLNAFGVKTLYCHGLLIIERLETHRPAPIPGERIEFGIHTMPRDVAEEAPAWPSLAAVRASADAKFRREQRKVRA